MTPQDKKEIQQMIDLALKNSFGKRIGDTPTDSLQLTPRKYVNMYGSVLGRPVNSVIGQFYLDTNKGGPIWRRSDGAWVDGVGSVV